MKVPQKIFSNSYVTELYNSVKTQDDVKRYIVDEFIYEHKYPKGEPIIQIESDIELKIPDQNSNYDFENSIILFNSFSELNETQASDPRLWTYLTHVTFWKYMKARWPINTDAGDLDSSIEKIRSHYFIPTINTRSFLRNGISRLWWYANLTYSEQLTDKFSLTKILLQDLDRTAAILERNLGRNRNILIAFLETLSENPELKREQIRRLAIHLNLMGGVLILTTLSKDEIKNILRARVNI